MGVPDILNRELQRRLEFLDEYIDTLEREKRAAGDKDLSTVGNAKRVQQISRQYYSRGSFHAAWYGVHYAETYVGLGYRELSDRKRLREELDKMLGPD